MNSGDLDFLMGNLERVTQLRKDSEKLHEILETEDVLSDILYDVTSEIVREILRDCSPETMESFISAMRKGPMEVEKSKERSPK